MGVVLGTCIVVQYFIFLLVWQHPAWEKRAGRSDFVIWMLCYCYYYLPLLIVPLVGLRYVSVVFPGHTHLLFWYYHCSLNKESLIGGEDVT